MIFKNVKKLSIPEGEVKRIESGGVLLWKSGYTNLVPTSINADGSIYNNGLGYKKDIRIRSGGAEGDYTYSTATGFIRVNPGDAIRIYDLTNANLTGAGTAINVSDANFTNIGQAASNAAYGIFLGDYRAYDWSSCVDEGNGVYRWTVPPAASGVVYIRVSVCCLGKTLGEKLVVTINEEIE